MTEPAAVISRTRYQNMGIVTLAAAALTAAGCGAGTEDAAPMSATPPPNPALAINLYSASDLAQMITDEGLPLPHARDVSRRDCPTIRCVDKIESSAVSIMTFANSGSAELYAGVTDHSFQLVNVVMVFAPAVSADRERAYESVVTHAIT